MRTRTVWPLRCPPCEEKAKLARRAFYIQQRSERRAAARKRRKAGRKAWKTRQLKAFPTPRCLDCEAELPKFLKANGRPTRTRRVRCDDCREKRNKQRKAERSLKAWQKFRKNRQSHDLGRPRTCKDCPKKLQVNLKHRSWPERCPECAAKRLAALAPKRVRRMRRRRRGEDVPRKENWLGQSVKRVLSLYPNTSLTPQDLFNEGWVKAAELLRAGEPEKLIYRRAEQHMEALAVRDRSPVSGDTKVTRQLRFVNELHPDYPSATPSHYTRRLTPGDWRQLKSTFRRVLDKQQAHLLTRMVCEHATLHEMARELGLPDRKVSALRSKAIRRVLKHVGVAASAA